MILISGNKNNWCCPSISAYDYGALTKIRRKKGNILKMTNKMVELIKEAPRKKLDIRQLSKDSIQNKAYICTCLILK